MGKYSGHAQAYLNDKFLMGLYDEFERSQFEAATFCSPDRDNDPKRLYFLARASVIKHLRTELKLLVDAED